MRYPGHVRLIQALKTAGFFGTEPIDLGDARVSPLELTSRILMDEWRLEPGEPECTIMRVTVEGREAGVRKAYVWELYDEYDTASGTSSMARTTGYTCTAAAGLILDGLFADQGVFPPELVGRRERCFRHMLDYLADRGVVYRRSERRSGVRP